MAVDYNLVILGGSLTARYAAAIASEFKARVALVEPQSFHASYQGLDADVAIAQIFQQAAHDHALVSIFRPESEPVSEKQLSEILLSGRDSVHTGLTHHLVQRFQDYSLDALATQGVDVIVGRGPGETGEFCRRPHLGVVADGRVLRSHAYLVTPASKPIIPEIQGLESVPYFTLDTVLKKEFTIEGRAVILGETPRSLELAQALAQLRMAVTLVVQSPTFLPQEDWDVAQWLLSTLEALGVDVLTGAIVTHVKSVGDEIQVFLEDQVIDTDHLILATPRRADFASLNLEAASLYPEGGWLSVTQTLKTSNARIYACGEAIAPVSAPIIAQYQALCAVKNALFLPTRQWGDRHFPSLIQTTPPCGHVGLTEGQAKGRLNHKVVTLKIPLQTEAAGVVSRKYLRDQQTSFLTVIVHLNGTILGAHCVGQAAGELLVLFALAMNRRLSIDQVISNYNCSGMYADIFMHLSWAWERERLKGDRRRQNILELVMNWQRDWSRG
ncbi:MAG: FAD-dependent oxidoreductase [Cyanobacteria bacterium P01_A01_bin.37]